MNIYKLGVINLNKDNKHFEISQQLRKVYTGKYMKLFQLINFDSVNL